MSPDPPKFIPTDTQAARERSLRLVAQSQLLLAELRTRQHQLERLIEELSVTIKKAPPDGGGTGD